MVGNNRFLEAVMVVFVTSKDSPANVESVDFLASFLSQCESTKQNGFSKLWRSLETEWLLKAFGIHASYGWCEDELLAAVKIIEVLKERPRDIYLLREATDRALEEIRQRSQFEAGFVIWFLKRLDKAIDQERDEIKENPAASFGHYEIAEIGGARRPFLRAVLTVLVAKRSEPFRRNLRYQNPENEEDSDNLEESEESSESDDEDDDDDAVSNVIRFPGSC